MQSGLIYKTFIGSPSNQREVNSTLPFEKDIIIVDDIKIPIQQALTKKPKKNIENTLQDLTQNDLWTILLLTYLATPNVKIIPAVLKRKSNQFAYGIQSLPTENEPLIYYNIIIIPVLKECIKIYFELIAEYFEDEFSRKVKGKYYLDGNHMGYNILST